MVNVGIRQEQEFGVDPERLFVPRGPPPGFPGPPRRQRAAAYYCYGFRASESLRSLAGNFGCAVGAVVVHDEDSDRLGAGLLKQRLHGGADDLGFVASWNDNRNRATYCICRRN